MNAVFRPLLIVLFLAPAAACAQQSVPDTADAERADQARAFAESVVAELELTDAQEEQVRAILESSAEHRQALISQAEAIRDGGGSRRTKFREMKSLRKDIQAQQASTRDALSDVLDDEQMEKLDEMMQAKRAELQEQMRARRSG
jgi:Spy/CpxP family protein refolding chaperone